MSRDPRKDRARKRRLRRREKDREQRRHNAFCMEWEARLDLAKDLPRCWTCGCRQASPNEACSVCGGASCPPSDW